MTIQTLVPDDLWQAIEPLLPPSPRRYGGRPRIDDRAALAGVVYQLHTGIPWRLLPTRELGCGSPITLAAAAGLATRRRVAATPPPAARPARPCQPAGLVAGEPGLDQRARQARGP